MSGFVQHYTLDVLSFFMLLDFVSWIVDQRLDSNVAMEELCNPQAFSSFAFCTRLRHTLDHRPRYREVFCPLLMIKKALVPTFPFYLPICPRSEPDLFLWFGA